jgi:hypothetical protein
VNSFKISVVFNFLVIALLPVLLPLTAQNLTKGPYLAIPNDSSITIRWESDSKTKFLVKYGEDNSFERSEAAKFIFEKKSGYLYEVNISGLMGARKYYYKVTSENISSNISSFKIGVNENKPLSFVVLGDSRSKPHIFKSIADQINKIDPAVIIANGDLVAKGGSYDNWQTQFFDPAEEMINHIPFITAVGDHESDEVDGDNANLFTHFLFPYKDSLKLWFSYDIGDAHFTFLDWRHPYNKEMVEWFKKDISTSDKTWNFVVMHRPSYNLGGHRSAWGRNIWPVLFREYKIDIVFAGHSHLYERFYPLRPLSQPNSWAVTYITTGGAGASLYEAIQHSSLAYTKSVNHFLKVEIEKNRIELKAIGIDGENFDLVSWSKNGGIVNSEYLATAKPQEELDIINVFNGPISERMERLPMVEVPYEPKLKLNSTKINEDIEFTIKLADESEGNYEMAPVSGLLKAASELDVQLKIFGKSTLTVTKWGDVTPMLRLIAEYKTNSLEGKVIGKILEYIAW